MSSGTLPGFSLVGTDDQAGLNGKYRRSKLKKLILLVTVLSMIAASSAVFAQNKSATKSSVKQPSVHTAHKVIKAKPVVKTVAKHNLAKHATKHIAKHTASKHTDIKVAPHKAATPKKS